MNSFAEFRDAYQYRGDKIYQLIYERHKYSLRGKRPEVVVRNLKLIFEHSFMISEQRGFYAMSLRDLSNSSQLSIGAVYGCINSKNDIPNIACDTISFLHTEFLQRYQQDNASHEVLMSHIRNSVYLAEILDSWFRFLIQEVKHLDVKSRICVSSLDRSHEQVLSALISGQRDSSISNDALLETEMIPRAVKSFIHQWCLRNDEYKQHGITVDQYATSLVNLVAKLFK